ncbi:MAG: hypothetical protein DRI24_18970 [Deltaproteobacteria bacterium]|nr:MAG: hypothetical protein DRI24_18970 [Deltaproteobacteria bacterium]
MINGAVINGHLINGNGVTGGEEFNGEIDFIESMFFADKANIDESNLLEFSESLFQNDNIHWKRGISIYETFHISPEITSTGTFLFDLIDAIHVVDSHSLGYLVSFYDGMNFTGDSDADRILAMSFVDALVFSSGMDTKHKAIMSIAEVFASVDALSSGFAFDLLESLGVADLTDGQHLLMFHVLESMLIDDNVEMQARISLFFNEDLHIEDITSAKGFLVANFSESFQISGVLNTPEGVFEAWAVNVETRAPYQYTNFPFNSFAMIGGRYYGADESGLFALDGTTDDGENIDAVIRTGLINFGTTLFKRIPRAYFGYTSTGQFLFNTITTEEGKKIERWYELKEKIANDTTNARVKMARGVKSVHWQFEIVNIDGASFDLDDVKLMPTILNRRQ